MVSLICWELNADYDWQWNDARHSLFCIHLIYWHIALSVYHKNNLDQSLNHCTITAVVKYVVHGTTTSNICTHNRMHYIVSSIFVHLHK